MKFLKYFWCSFIVCITPYWCSAEDWSGTINTDRPDFTESALTVPEGMTQVETGFTFQSLEDVHSTTAPETLIRHTISKDIELRLGAPSWHITRSHGSTSSNFDDVYAGVKWGLEKSASRYFELSIITATFIPAGNDANTAWSPEIKICTSSDFNDMLGLSTMAYFRSDTSDDSRKTIYQQTASFEVRLADRLTSFYEYLFETYHDGPFSQLAHVGVSYLLTPDSQVDVHLGRNLSGGYSEPFIGAGFAFRF